MVFSSIFFICAFLPVVFLLSRCGKNIRYKNTLLFVSSLIFYAFGQLVYVPLFLGSILLNYSAGVLLLQFPRKKRFFLSAAVILNLLTLFIFKYADFSISIFNSVFSASLKPTGIVLPIGISFFTFQGMSYVIDTYREPENGTRDFMDLALYISFFPQLIAGPIVKYHDIALQIRNRSCTMSQTAAGVQRFIQGLAKKVLIANTVAAVSDHIFELSKLNPEVVRDFRLMWIAGFAYMLHIYFDFSGYSDMAIGLGKMFGFTFLENFNYPYSAVTIKDFWRRWHISLSSWFKEYLYIPLGGNRKGKSRTVINKMIVFLCTGIWHGANWTFLVWGVSHGILSSLEDVFQGKVRRFSAHWSGKLILRLGTLFSVGVLFMIFKADSVTTAFQMIRGLFSFHITALGSELLSRDMNYAVAAAMIIGSVFASSLPLKIRNRISSDGTNVRPVFTAIQYSFSILLFFICICSLAGSHYNPFIYFQF